MTATKTVGWNSLDLVSFFLNGVEGLKMDKDQQDIIIYNTTDGKASVSLFAKNDMVWMNQNQLAELFDTSKQNIGQHIAKILKENELDENSVAKNYFTTASDEKEYNGSKSKRDLSPVRSETQNNYIKASRPGRPGRTPTAGN